MSNTMLVRGALGTAVDCTTNPYSVLQTCQAGPPDCNVTQSNTGGSQALCRGILVCNDQTLRALTGLSDVNRHGRGPNLVAIFMLVFVSF